MTVAKPIVAAAKGLLVLPGEDRSEDLWLWEHAERVTHLVQLLALLPEVREIGEDPPDATVAAAAALFADAGWAVQVRGGEVNHWHVLTRPTNDIQRELGVGALQEHVGKLLPSDALERAARAIREWPDRYTKLPEARVLAEAENLDEIGVMYVLRQFRRYQATGRSLSDLMVSWNGLLEYHFWEARINSSLRWEVTRRVARERLKAVEQFMGALARDREASDLHHVLESVGIDAASIARKLA